MTAADAAQEALRLTEPELRAWVIATGHALGPALEPVARVVPAVWIFEALRELPFETSRPAVEALAASPLPHIAHAALARLLEVSWPGRPAWALRALRDPARDAQVIALEAAPHFNDDDVAYVATMLSDPAADARLIAVEALAAVEGEAQTSARWLLQLHLPSERSARVRRHILETPGVVALLEGSSLADAPEGAAAALAARADATVTALAKPVAPWFAERPPLHWEDGSDAPGAVGEYVLFCQHACSGAELDPRAIEAAALLEGRSLAWWAGALLDAWVARKADVKFHWCLALAVALGGDAVVPAVQREVESWHRGGRRALSSLGAQLLACLGGDRAARALDELARGHGYDALGAFATSALAAEAAERGLSRDDLSDAVVPRWGMSAEGKAWLDYGRRRFRVTLELAADGSFDTSLTETRWRVLTAPPKPNLSDDPARAAEAQARWKALRHELPRVVEAERRRLEEAMCAGRVWTATRWTERVLGHPVLRALAERLVWAVSAPGRRRPTLVRTTHGALLNERGTTVRLRDDATVTLVHPIDLDDAERQRWAEVLAEAKLPPQPFAQLARATFAAGDAAATSWAAVEGRVLTAPSDRKRSRPPAWTRAGWEAAPIEAGLCRRFLRRYGETEAVLEVEGIALWAEQPRDTVVRGLRFRAAREGAAWMPLGEVAPAVVSEAARAAAHLLHGVDDADRAAAAFVKPLVRKRRG